MNNADQPAFKKRLDNKRSAIKETPESSLSGMLKSDKLLYEKILDTPGFAYYFNQLALIAQCSEMEQQLETTKPKP